MSWLLRASFQGPSELRQRLQVGARGVGLLHTSPALPLQIGDSFILEASLAASGQERWVHGAVRARGTGALTLQLTDARQLLRWGHGSGVPARRSPRYGADLPIFVAPVGGEPQPGVLLEVSADGARVQNAQSPAGRELELSLQVGGVMTPLARARICWRTPTTAGLQFVQQPAGAVVLSRLLRLLSVRWSEALPLLLPGEAAPPDLRKTPPPPLEDELAKDLAPLARVAPGSVETPSHHLALTHKRLAPNH